MPASDHASRAMLLPLRHAHSTAGPALPVSSTGVSLAALPRFAGSWGAARCLHVRGRFCRGGSHPPCPRTQSTRARVRARAAAHLLGAGEGAALTRAQPALAWAVAIGPQPTATAVLASRPRTTIGSGRWRRVHSSRLRPLTFHPPMLQHHRATLQVEPASPPQATSQHVSPSTRPGGVVSRGRVGGHRRRRGGRLCGHA